MLLSLFLTFLGLFLREVLCLHLSKIPVHKVTIKTHPVEIVSSLLYDAYAAVYSLNPQANPSYITNYESMALQYSGSQSCVENAAIRYYLVNASLVHKEYPASECILNTNNQYQAVVTPTSNFHLSVHGMKGRLSDELDYKTRLYLEQISTCQYDFNNFTGLNYNLECASDYYELMQVNYREAVVEARLQIAVTVSDECPFSDLNSSFGTEYDKAIISVEIPVNGSFYCHVGRSATCRMSMAHTRNARYRLFD